MSMSHHAWRPRPPIFYRTRRPWWRRLRGLIAVLAVVGGLALGLDWLIARIHATDAQLQGAFSQGMTSGLLACPGR